MRPEWWPSHEPWPPLRSHGRNLRFRFLRRMGCLLGMFFLIFPVFFVLLVGLVANAVGIIQISGENIGWIIPLSILAFISSVVIFVWAVRGLRRISIPFGNLVEASSRLAEGDYGVRVTEQGPPEVRSIERAFNEMATRLQISSQKRRDLLADLTHELRTPITVIQGSVEGMLDGIYAPNNERLKSIYDETQMLARLVEDLRTLALAESGALELRKEPTDLGMLILDTVRSFQPQAETAQISLQSQICEPAPIVNLDPLRFREVLNNLISNALRYTPAGGTIRVEANSLSIDGETKASVTIRDTGQGIKPEDLPHVFERFYKTGDSGGMGLGLAIAKYIIEAHHGEIHAESIPGEGTTMRVVI